jgi:Lipocalin-like domain
MQRRIIAALTGLAFLTLPSLACAQEVNSPIVGLWKLTSNVTKFVATGEMRPISGEHPIGYQLFTKGGHMIYVQNSENRKRPASATATDAERVALFNSMVAYAGTYKLDGPKVLIHMEANGVPGEPDRVYAMEISGNKLTLTADRPFMNASGQQIISIRTFERAE